MGWFTGVKSGVLVTLNNLLGELGPKEPVNRLVAEFNNAQLICRGVAVGLLCKKSAATPATCGADIEVPLMVFESVLELNHADLILEPGANKSTQTP